MSRTKGFRRAWEKREGQLLKKFEWSEGEIETVKSICAIFYHAGTKDGKKREENKARYVPNLERDELELKLARAQALNKTFSQLVAGIGEELKSLASKQQVIEMNFQKITLGNNEAQSNSAVDQQSG